MIPPSYVKLQNQGLNTLVIYKSYASLIG